MTPHASALVQIGIPALALGVLSLVALAIARTSGRRGALLFALAAVAWLAFTAALASSGFLTNFASRPPRMLLLLLPTLALPLALGFSRTGTALAEAQVALLVLFHAFRLPLELVMHQAALEGTMPLQMTYTGCNFDIVSGATALLVGGLAAWGRAPRALLLAWNALGSLLLATIVAIAVASLPAFAAFGQEPARLNTWIAYFPYVWLPAGLVSAALLGHVLLWRRLLSRGMRGRALSALL
jgi:hypothetical protein